MRRAGIDFTAEASASGEIPDLLVSGAGVRAARVDVIEYKSLTRAAASIGLTLHPKEIP